MNILRTPDERFADLEDYDFAPHYREVTTDEGVVLRYHFLDEGPRDAAPILLLHGNPSWAYLYRNMIPGLVARGHRVLALDLMGLGRSDKPDDRAFYTLARHVDWMGQWLEGEDLRDITLFCQDWGGIFGLNLVAAHPDRFARVIASNTGLPEGEGSNEFLDGWLAYSQSLDEFPIAMLMGAITTRPLTDGEVRGYEAPFPDASYQTSPMMLPTLIPMQPDNPGVPQCRETWAFLDTFEKPFLTIFGSADQIAYAAGSHVKFQERIPGAAGQAHHVIEGANHFIQDDAPDELVERIDAFTR